MLTSRVIETMNEIFSCRKRDGSTDSGKMTPQLQEMKISLLEREKYTLSNKTFDNDEKNGMLDQNLRRFEEERRQFELEKLKFLEEKRELDRLRLQRFERYKREIEAKRLGLKPNYDIDNNDYMVARKVVIDCKLNDVQDSGSESEPDITVVENVVSSEIKDEAKNDNESTPATNGCEPAVVITSVDETDCVLKTTESLNGVEKALDKSFQEITLEKVDFASMKLWPLTKLLLRETRQIWIIHKHRHMNEWKRLKGEVVKCFSELLMLMVFCGMGGLVFRYVEGNYEIINKAGVKRVKRDFIDHLWLSSHNLR